MISVRTDMQIRFSLALAVLFSAAQFVPAQIGIESPDGRSWKENFPDHIVESLAEKRIRDEEEEHRELVSRAQDAASMGAEIAESYMANGRLLPDQRKQLKPLEKLVKKVLSGLRGKTDGEETESPESVADAVTEMRVKLESLDTEVEKMSRHAVSARAIELANDAIRLIDYLRSRD